MAGNVPFVPITPPDNSGDSLVQSLFGATDVGDMLGSAFLIAINVGAILAMIRIIYGGWLYMGRSDMWSSKHHAKEVLQDAVIGLLILLAVWLILYQINPQILNVSSFGTALSGSE